VGVKNPGISPNPSWLTDERLTAADLGLLTYLAHRPRNWVAPTEALMERFHLGRHALRTIYRHLEELGYLRKYSAREGTRWAGSGYVLLDPMAAQGAVSAQAENQPLISKKASRQGKPHPSPSSAPAAQPQEPTTKPAPKTTETTREAMRVARETRANRYGAEKIIRRGMTEFGLTATEVADQLIALGTNNRGVTMDNMRAAFTAAAESVAICAHDSVPPWAKGMTPQQYRLAVHFEGLRYDNPDAEVALTVLEDIASRTDMPVNYGHVRHWHEELATIPRITGQEAVDAARTLPGVPKAHEVALQVKRARHASQEPAPVMVPAPVFPDWMNDSEPLPF
jgi:hypothetical protein